MKKIIIAAALVLGFAVAASAQPRAIGVRVGNGGEVSYQHSLGNNFLEVDGGLGLGFDGVFNVGATGIYNFMIAQPSWTPRGEWGFYAGPGAGVGLGLGDVNYFNISAAGMVGLEYSFWFPLQLSLDFRQHIGIRFNGDPLWAPSSVGLGIRYKF
jgi:hypothetical protein